MFRFCLYINLLFLIGIIFRFVTYYWFFILYLTLYVWIMWCLFLRSCQECCFYPLCFRWLYMFNFVVNADNYKNTTHNPYRRVEGAV